MKTLIPFLILCLIATCNAELRTWTAVNGKEVEAEFVSNEKGIVKLKLKTGKIFEVPANKLSKEDNEFISSLDKPEGVNSEELEYREGFYYLLDSDTPYTGKSFTLWKNGQKETESNYKDGKQNGLEVWWHKNGQKEQETNFKDGKPNGLWVNWHENGQKSGEENYKDGKAYGVKMEWHPNGQKKMEGNFKDNKLVEGSKKFWNSKGEPVKLESVNEDELERREGIMYLKGSDTPYTGKRFTLYEFGKKKKEVNFKDGKKDGLQMWWHENGKKAIEVNYKDGKPNGLWVNWHENGQKMRESNWKDGKRISRKYWNSKGEPVDSLGETRK